MMLENYLANFCAIVCNHRVCSNEYKRRKISTNDGVGFRGFSLILGFGACENITASHQELPSIHVGHSFTWKCCFYFSFDDYFADNCLDLFGIVDLSLCPNVLCESKRTLSNDSQKDREFFRRSKWHWQWSVKSQFSASGL